MVRVIFEWDEDVRKWSAKVEGAETPLEARQAFSAVVLTCQELPSQLLNRTKVDEQHNITPCVF
jgi:hypothetical protein